MSQCAPGLNSKSQLDVVRRGDEKRGSIVASMVRVSVPWPLNHRATRNRTRAGSVSIESTEPRNTASARWSSDAVFSRSARRPRGWLIQEHDAAGQAALGVGKKPRVFATTSNPTAASLRIRTPFRPNAPELSQGASVNDSTKLLGAAVSFNSLLGRPRDLVFRVAMVACFSLEPRKLLRA
jgi:hypothetical protein